MFERLGKLFATYKMNKQGYKVTPVGKTVLTGQKRLRRFARINIPRNIKIDKTIENNLDKIKKKI